MADVELWIQIENHAWDVAPNNIERISGQTIEALPGGKPPVTNVTLTSPVTGFTRTGITMYRPVTGDALILRRYTENWAAPDDRKVNPWDLNEPDPTDNGTMGTIPGPVIECEVGDRVIVHFRNKDHRVRDVKTRTHSLHPHGFVFNVFYDGAYPLSPPDTTQPVGAQALLWGQVGVFGFKQGDRVPPDADFTYTWETLGWPTTAGVWLYHDHAICDMDNVKAGAIGIIVIHNSADPDDVLVQDLPGGQSNGPLTRLRCFPFPFEVPVLPHELERIGAALGQPPGMEHATEMGEEHDPPQHREDEESPREDLLVRFGNLLLELDPEFGFHRRICLPYYTYPPQKAQYLQLYHEMPGVGMLINGRKYLGNTPTVLAGLNTKMRFGLVGMNDNAFHTFHLHGHRWTIPGPDGSDPGAIQGSPQVTAVSQFEDTRTFGPANSFAFTINQGSFMGSLKPPEAPGRGEWHMHCHVLGHMHDGMMGSLLVIDGTELAFALPHGVPCPPDVGPLPPPQTIDVEANAFVPNTLSVAAGANVTFNFKTADHTVTTTAANMADPIELNDGPGNVGTPSDAVPLGELRTVPVVGMAGGSIDFVCGIHGFTGTINIT